MKSRRALLAGSVLAATAALSTAAVALPSTAGISGDDSLDAELLALRPVWLAGLAAYQAALEAHSPVEDRAMARYPAYPAHTDRSEEAARRTAEVKAERKVIAAEEGLHEAERLQNETEDADAAMVYRIAETPALTLAGILFKVEVAKNWDYNHSELVEAIMDDIKALGAHGMGS